MRHSVVVGLVALLILLPASHLRAEDALAHAKDLYLSAAYDEALVVLEQLKSQPAPAAANRGRAVSRVLPARAWSAATKPEKTIADIVAAEPFYRPSDTQTSPRIRAVFDETRKALLPGLVQRTYADAKASFEKKDPKAVSQFELVLALLDDPDLKGLSQLADLRTVVSGFRDLSKAMAGVPPPAAPKPVEAPAPAQAADSAAAQAATVVDPSSDRVPDVSLGFTPPVVISQPIPRWAPPDTVDRRSGFKGLIEVTIDENGNVTSATLQQSVHPLYDEKLLAMARTWKYKPAMRNGVPTLSLKVVEIRLQPAR